MKSTIIREFNEHEREAIRTRLAMMPSPRRSLGYLFVSLTMTGIFVYGFLQKKGWLWAGLTIISALILVGVLYKVVRNLSWLRLEGDERKRKIMEAIEHNRVEVLHLKPSAAVSVYDYAKEDEIACFYDIGNKHILCIYWRWLRRVPTNWDWPNDCFEVVLTTKHRLVVGIYCYGEKLKSIRYIDFDHHRLDEVSKMFDIKLAHPIAIFEGSLDNIEEILQKEPVEVWM
ncbi:MAG: hypothetical protein GTN76_10195 [Candidatus Aenigmarchaeota archaeon]|nr:hypothetical protein [Candidatus Aenigmarchaeota archaeon]